MARDSLPPLRRESMGIVIGFATSGQQSNKKCGLGVEGTAQKQGGDRDVSSIGSGQVSKLDFDKKARTRSPSNLRNE